MTKGIEKRILGSFLLGTFIVLVMGCASVWLARGVEQARSKIVNDQVIINTVYTFLQSVVDAETGQRGYLISADPKYLDSYSVGISAAAAGLTKLQLLLPDSSNNKQSVIELHDLLRIKLMEMARTITLDQTVGFPAAKALVDSDVGYDALDKIRLIDRHLSQIYVAKLDKDISQASHRIRLLGGVLLILAICISVLLFWTYLLLLFGLRNRSKMSKDLEHATNHDPLTSMPNRQFFYDLLKYALSQAEREHRQAAILLLNLDSFKSANDFFGYEGGNKLLQVVASRLMERSRIGDVFARLGGDEFAVLVPILSDSGDPANLALNLVEGLALPFDENESLSASASIGIAVYPADGESPELLLAAADAAMRRAKAAGGNRFQFFLDADNVAQSRDLRIRADLFGCVEQNQLTVHYQPVVDSRGNIQSLEALVRWDHPTLGHISPKDFIPLAERSGAISKIGRYVRQTVIAQAGNWLQAGILVPIAVNMSATEFLAADLVKTMLMDLHLVQLPAKFLTIELVETVLLKPESKETMRSLCEAGVNLVLDDFGTGFSSLSYLLHYPVNGVKIDRSFVAGLPHNEESRKIVAVILQMAATLRLNVIAEGVETREQVTWLTAQGCRRFQGFFFGRPIGADAMGYYLANQVREAPSSV